MTFNRIITGYCEGKSGDTGYSLLMHGVKIRKDDEACEVYSNVEHLSNTISELLDNYSLQNKEVVKVLTYLRSNLFSFSSFCFMKGKSTDHMLPLSFLEHIVARIAVVKEGIGDADDFILHSKVQLRVLDKIRIYIRDIERSYIAWYYHPEVIKDVLLQVKSNPELAQLRVCNMDLIAQILNRLSAYIFWETRLEHKLLQADGQIDDETYWFAKIEPFPCLM